MKILIMLIFSLALISCETKQYDQEENAVRTPSSSEDNETVEFDGIESITPYDDFSATVNWTHEEGIARYYVWNTTGGAIDLVATLNAPASSFKVTDLESGKNYSFKVTAQSDEGLAVDNINELYIWTNAIPDTPTSVSLADPTYSTYVDSTPSFNVSTTRATDTIVLYKDNCLTEVGRASAVDGVTTVTVKEESQLATGFYIFYVKVINKNGVESNCSSSNFVGAAYTYQTCPPGYIEVPTNLGVGNTPFCVMSYEARAWYDFNGNGYLNSTEVDTVNKGCQESGCTSKNWGTTLYKPGSGVYGYPWRNIDQRTAKTECQSLGDGYDLISNKEWMVIAREIEETSSNWSGGVAGIGCMTRGNIGVDDKCSYDNFGIDGGSGRTSPHSHTLSNGNVIYDFVGNASEWIDLGVEEDITLAPLYCEAEWQNAETIENYCSNEFFDYEYKPANSGALTFETYDNVYHLIHDANGALYVSTDGGVAKTENQASSFSHFTRLNGLASHDITGGVFVDDNGHIYVGTEKGLHISTNSGETFTRITTSEGLGSDIIYSVYVKQGYDSGSNQVQVIYAATNAGLSISTDGGVSFTNHTTTSGLAHNATYSVFLDDDNNVYVGTLNGLSISYDDGDMDSTDLSFVSVNKSANNLVGGVSVWDAAASNRVNKVLVDKKGYIYVATNLGLLMSINNGKSFVFINTDDGLTHDRIHSVYVDDNDESDNTDDILYVATESGLNISTDNGATFGTRFTTSGLADNTVYDIITDSDDNIYAATQSGLSISYDDGDTFTLTRDSSNGLGGKSTVGLGKIYGGIGQGAYRGGSYKSGGYAGIYMMSFELKPEQTFDDYGFRCVYRP